MKCMNVLTNELKMSAEEIRAAMDLEKTVYTNVDETTCYAYMLGLDVPEKDIVEWAYIPGVMSGAEKDLTTCSTFYYKDFITNFYKDLEFLGIEYREVLPNEPIGSDEWKIAILLRKYWSQLDDYHFLRLGNDGIWRHKFIYHQPTIYDSMGQIITNPETASFYPRYYDKCLSLRLK